MISHAWPNQTGGPHVELSDFRVNVPVERRRPLSGPGRLSHGLHLRGLGLLMSRATMRRDLTLVPLERFDECCGFGGSFSVRYPGISGAMVEDKAGFTIKSGADTLVATDAGCLMNIGGCLRRRQPSLRIKHLAEVLAQE